MNKYELEIYKETRQMVSDLISSQKTYESKIDEKIDALSDRIDQKHIPIQFEPAILSSVQNSILEVIKTTLTGYNSPLTPIIRSVIESHTDSIRDQFSEVLKLELGHKEFKDNLRDTLSVKLAKSLIAGIDKSVDTVTDDLKRNPEFSSRLKLLVIDLVNEFKELEEVENEE